MSISDAHSGSHLTGSPGSAFSCWRAWWLLDLVAMAGLRNDLRAGLSPRSTALLVLPIPSTDRNVSYRQERQPGYRVDLRRRYDKWSADRARFLAEGLPYVLQELEAPQPAFARNWAACVSAGVVYS